MPNRHRGEIEAILDGRPHTLCLTLGALAELEAAFGVDDLAGLIARLAERRLSARDAITIVAAGLRGAGHDADLATVAAMRAEGAAAGFARIVGELLEATFSDPEEARENPPQPRRTSGPTAPLASPGGR